MVTGRWICVAVSLSTVTDTTVVGDEDNVCVGQAAGKIYAFHSLLFTKINLKSSVPKTQLNDFYWFIVLIVTEQQSCISVELFLNTGSLVNNCYLIIYLNLTTTKENVPLVFLLHGRKLWIDYIKHLCEGKHFGDEVMWFLRAGIRNPKNCLFRTRWDNKGAQSSAYLLRIHRDIKKALDFP